jgi:outer membrane receptor protein involved in Fe transport
LRDESVKISEIFVYGASKKNERLTDAPAAVSVVEPTEIQLYAGLGQLPKLLETQPGVDIVQNGINDFNINTRGFNSSLNRRLVVLLDGRDLAIAFLAAQEWNGLSVPVEDLGRLELIRGPSSALYGANAFNGVINIQSPSPKEIQGTKATIAAGELNTFRGDIRYAAVRDRLSYKINVGRFQGNTWSVSRKNLTFEYPGFSILNNEDVDLHPGLVASTYGSARIDYDWDKESQSTIEAGVTKVENEVFVTGIGRVQVPNTIKPWARVNYSNTILYVQLWTAGRDSREPQISLSSGLPLIERSSITNAEIQYRNTLFDPNLFFIGGISFRYQEVNSDGTLMKAPRYDNFVGFYGQFEYTFSEKFKGMAAARWDLSTLYDRQFSPKIALVWSPTRDHSFRATFNQAFQFASPAEKFLYILRTATNPYTGLKSYIAYLGNENLNVEKITGYELGYKGIFGKTFFISVDCYYNLLKDFITDLAPGVHPNYPPGYYQLPGDTVKDQFGVQVARSVWSYNNAGKVTEGGFEIGVNYYLSDTWLLDANYSFFDFAVQEKSPQDILLPNTPKHKPNIGITYMNKDIGLDVGVKVKYVPSFEWAAGIYQGTIPSYALVNFASSYKITSHLVIGVTVSNLFDREHYEIFGGSLLRRKALATLTVTF